MSMTIGKRAVCAAAFLLAHTATLAQMPGQGMPGMNPGQGPQPGMNAQMMQPGMQPGMNPMGMPMMMQGQQGHAPLMATAAGYLYILRGNSLFQYTLKDLKLAAQVQLPMDRPRLNPMPGGAGMLPPLDGGAPPPAAAEPPAPASAPGNQSPSLQDQEQSGQMAPQGPPMGQGPMPGQDPMQMMQMQGMGGMGMQGMGMPGMGMPMMMGAPPMNLIATADQVVVLRGNSIFSFSAKGLEPTGRADLPTEQPRPLRGAGGATRPVRPRANP